MLYAVSVVIGLIVGAIIFSVLAGCMTEERPVEVSTAWETRLHE